MALTNDTAGAGTTGTSSDHLTSDASCELSITFNDRVSFEVIGFPGSSWALCPNGFIPSGGGVRENSSDRCRTRAFFLIERTPPQCRRKPPKKPFRSIVRPALLRSESPREYAIHRKKIFQRFSPSDYLEEYLLDQYVKSSWEVMRNHRFGPEIINAAYAAGLQNILALGSSALRNRYRSPRPKLLGSRCRPQTRQGCLATKRRCPVSRSRRSSPRASLSFRAFGSAPPISCPVF